MSSATRYQESLQAVTIRFAARHDKSRLIANPFEASLNTIDQTMHSRPVFCEGLIWLQQKTFPTEFSLHFFAKFS